MYNVLISNGDEVVVINRKRSNNRVDGTFTIGKNAIPTCQFNIYSNNDGFNKIRQYITLIRILDNDGKQVFGGRVVSVQFNIDSTGVACKTVICEGWMGYLNDSISYEYSLIDTTRSRTLQQLINHHNSTVNEEKEIQLKHFDIENSYIDYNYFNVKTLEAMMNEEMLASGYTYEVVEDMDKGILELEYIHPIEYSSATIELGKNIESINVQNNFDDLCTRVIPLTSDGVGLGNTSQGVPPYVDAEEAAIRKYGIIIKVHQFEGVSNPERLPNTAKVWLENNCVIKSTFSLTTLDLYKLGLTLQGFELYKKYRTICRPLNIDEYVELTQITRDINDESEVKLTFGDKKYKMSEYKE